jgi:hypothetical protein
MHVPVPSPVAASGESAKRRPEPEQQAEALKERIYISFTALAVSIALERHAAETTVAVAAGTLGVTVFGTLLAVFVADILSHMTVHSSLPNRAELRHIVTVSLGSMVVLIAPMILLGAAALDVIALGGALRAISLVLVATLALVTLVAVRRLRVPLWQKVLSLVVVVVLALAVITLELAVH